MRCFLSFLRQSARVESIYRFDFWMRVLYTLIAMLGAKWLWEALYAQNPDIVGRDLPMMTTYAMLAMALDWVLSSLYAPTGYMTNQVRSGAIDTDLLKPIGFHRHMLYRSAGEMLLKLLVQALPAVVFAMLFLGMRPPASWAHGLLFLVSFGLGYLVLFSLNFLLGLLGMVTLNIRYLGWAYGGVVGLLSGKLVPLWLFPAGVRAVIGVLPFRFIYDVPLNIYTGATGGMEMLALIALQAVWALLLLALGQRVWRRVQYRLVVQGG